MKFQDVLNNTNSSVSFIFLVFQLLCSSFNHTKLKQKFIEEYVLYKTEEINEDNQNIDKSSSRKNFCIIEENVPELKHEKDKISEIGIIKSKKLKENKDDYLKIKIAHYLPFYINLLSCKCINQKYDSNNVIIDTIYEYYESIIDVTNILNDLYQIKKFIKLKNLEKNFRLKISNKILPNN